MKLSELYGLASDRQMAFLNHFAETQSPVRDMIERSFLSADAKADYEKRFMDRLRAVAD